MVPAPSSAAAVVYDWMTSHIFQNLLKMKTCGEHQRSSILRERSVAAARSETYMNAVFEVIVLG